MASAECDLELEDGEINDLEDGEIDEDILLPTESNNNVFSRLEPRQHAYPENSNSYGAIRRDFVPHNLGPSSARWETHGGPITPSQGRFPRGRTTPPRIMGGGSGKSSYSGNGPQVMDRGKSFAARRENTRKSFLQRPNLPHFPSEERFRGPYPQPENKARAPHLDEKWHGCGYPDTERPRLPHPLLNKKNRLPLMELDQNLLPSQNRGVDSTALAPYQQSARMESPLDEEEVDDYRIWLQCRRHCLGQKGLEQMGAKEGTPTAAGSIYEGSQLVKENNQAPAQHRNGTRGKLSRGHKNRKNGDQEFSRQTLDALERNHDREQGYGPYSDDDDLATLRAKALKSLAVKRKAKLDVGMETKSSPKQSSSSSSRVQSPTMAANNEQQKKFQRNSRKVSFVAPPKHEPVVIKLGEDSEKAGGDLFELRLEMMIKEARKAAEVSKKARSAASLPTEGSPQTYVRTVKLGVRF